MPEPDNVTGLLQAADRGDVEAANRLFLLVQEDLKKIARKHKRAAGVGGEICTTILVDNVFLRLVGKDVTPWRPGDRRKFFGYASTKLHDMLIDLLREQRAAKRGGGQAHGELAEDMAASASGGQDLELLIDLKEVLGRLEHFALEDAIVFRMRFFLDSTFEEIAQIMGISKSEAVRSCQRTRLWLQRELEEYNVDT